MAASSAHFHGWEQMTTIVGAEDFLRLFVPQNIMFMVLILWKQFGRRHFITAPYVSNDPFIELPRWHQNGPKENRIRDYSLIKPIVQTINPGSTRIWKDLNDRFLMFKRVSRPVLNIFTFIVARQWSNDRDISNRLMPSKTSWESCSWNHLDNSYPKTKVLAFVYEMLRIAQ